MWQFHTVPEPGEFGYETWPKDAYKYVGGANNVGRDVGRRRARHRLSADRLGHLRLLRRATGIGANLFANCLLALDARTGKRLWHFQTVHHDLWDYDNVSAPQLVTVRHNGRRIDAVAHRRQDRIPVRLQPRDGRAALADRRAAGAADRHAR